MSKPYRHRRRPQKMRDPYGLSGRGEHETLRVGHVIHPQWTRKLVRMVTRVFR